MVKQLKSHIEVFSDGLLEKKEIVRKGGLKRHTKAVHDSSTKETQMIKWMCQRSPTFPGSRNSSLLEDAADVFENSGNTKENGKRSKNSKDLKAHSEYMKHIGFWEDLADISANPANTGRTKEIVRKGGLKRHTKAVHDNI